MKVLKLKHSISLLKHNLALQCLLTSVSRICNNFGVSSICLHDYFFLLVVRFWRLPWYVGEIPPEPSWIRRSWGWGSCVPRARVWEAPIPSGCHAKALLLRASL